MINYFTKLKKIFAILLTAVLVYGCLFINHTFVRANADNIDNSAEIQDEKILSYYHEATTQENFEGNKINVILKRAYSNLSEIGFKDFKVVEQIAKISSISHNLKEVRRGSEETLPLLVQENQIITLELATQNKSTVLEAIERLNTLDMVLVAEPSYIYETEECWTPDDSEYGSQWGLNGTNGIQVEQAWNITRGNTDLKIGVMEAGIDLTHEDLQGRVFNGNITPSSDASLNHGTHVAGIIGAKKNDYGIAGVADVTMYLLNPSSSEFANSLTFAMQNNIKIINASFDYMYSDGAHMPYNSTHFTALKNYNGLFVCCAHNQNINLDNTPLYPASYDLPNIITVGAIAESGEKRETSNYGEKTVDIYAPGENILSTLPSNRYAYMSGTSMATPHVTGVAALMLSIRPNLTAFMLKEILIKTADNITISTPDGSQTVKKLNAYHAVNYVNQAHRFLFNGGDGSVSAPFEINNATQFRNIGLAYREVYVPQTGNENQINYYFKLTNDIILTEDWTPFEYKFTGNFNGNGHYITYHMELTKADLATQSLGLFRFVTGEGRFDNLILKNCTIASDVETELTASTSPVIGILAGSIYGARGLYSVEVINPTINCNITGATIGGIAGTIYSTTVSDCVVNGGSLTSYSGALGGMAGGGDILRFKGGSCATTLTKYHYTDSDSIGQVVGNSTETSSVSANVTINRESDEGGSCLMSGTLITLADGSQVPVETLTGNEMLLVWDLQTGQFGSAPILFIDSDPEREYEVIRLDFSDGTQVKVIYEHGFWDCDLNEYVYLRSDAEKYIGHWFEKQSTDENGELTREKVQLSGVSISREITCAYSPITYGQFCYYVDGMLSMPGGISGMFNIFAVDAETMRYDELSMQADIEEFGLFTYEEFSEMVPVSEEVFEAFNGQYLKVAIGKGLIDLDTLNSLAARYSRFLDTI